VKIPTPSRLLRSSMRSEARRLPRLLQRKNSKFLTVLRKFESRQVHGRGSRVCIAAVRRVEFRAFRRAGTSLGTRLTGQRPAHGL
jgi:hypothetical protein